MAGDFNSVVFAEMFGSAVKDRAQQMEEKLSDKATMEDLNGAEAKFINFAGATEFVDIVSDFQDTPYLDVPLSRRLLSASDSSWAVPFTPQQDWRTSVDYNSVYTRNAGYALARKRDRVMINAFDAAVTEETKDATTGLNTQSSVAFTSAQEVDASGHLTVAVLRSVLKKFELNDIPSSSPKYWAYGPEQKHDLLAITEITSTDFNTQRALVQGQVTSFMGFTFIMSNLLPLASAGIRKNFVWTPDAMAYTEPMLQFNSDKLPTKNYATQVHVALSAGAVRLEDKGVVRVLATET